MSVKLSKSEFNQIIKDLGYWNDSNECLYYGPFESNNYSPERRKEQEKRKGDNSEVMGFIDQFQVEL